MKVDLILHFGVPPYPSNQNQVLALFGSAKPVEHPGDLSEGYLYTAATPEAQPAECQHTPTGLVWVDDDSNALHGGPWDAVGYWAVVSLGESEECNTSAASQLAEITAPAISDGAVAAQSTEMHHAARVALAAMKDAAASLKRLAGPTRGAASVAAHRMTREISKVERLMRGVIPVRPDWTMPELPPECPSCGTGNLFHWAYNDVGEVHLGAGCDECGHQVLEDIDWPFTTERCEPEWLKTLGFEEV